MKKRNFIFWTVMGSFIALGICLSILGAVMGGTLYSIDSFSDSPESPNTTSTLNPESYSNVKNIDFDLSYGSIKIRQGDAFAISGDVLSRNEVSQSDQTWHIETKKRRRSVRVLGLFSVRIPPRAGNYTITLPRDVALSNVNIEVAAAEVEIENLTASNITVNGGAGSIDIDHINATESCKLKVGAGEISAEEGRLGGISTFKCSAGNIDIELASLTGTANLQCSVGNIDLTLPAYPSDYVFNKHANLGDIEIDSDDSDHRHDSDQYGNPLATLNLDCNLGNIDVDFAH